VKPFPELSEAGQTRRLTALAEVALAEYAITPKRVSLLSRHTNTFFRVDGVDGRRVALRIGPHPAQSHLHVRTEIAWLIRLRRDAGVPVPVPIAAESGAVVIEVTGENVPGRRSCVLFEWIPGRPVGDAAAPLDYVMLGETAAHLHDQASRWKRRHRLRPLVWDRVFYYPDELPVIYDGRFRHLMTKERTAIVKRVERKAAKELRRIHRVVDLMMLHGDLQPSNVHLHAGRMHVLDFEEVMLGAPVQDIAITLWHAKRHRDYPQVLDAFIEGYRTVREWPVEFSGQVNLLMAARSIMVLDYAMRRGVATDALVEATVAEVATVL
jgi:Ser/Thr protein kinase RdoA (MazF antagonist)